jgi:fructose/tagatose bisphosphate aldolase
MAIVSFRALMDAAERGGYAVGYFESWNLESLAAVADAAESTRSPVILGFSGIHLPHPGRAVQDRLSWYYQLGRAVGERLTVPCCLLFNEAADRAWVEEAIELGFDLVMFTDESLSPEDQAEGIAEVVRRAHPQGVAVEGELAPLVGAGIGGAPPAGDRTARGDDAEEAARFVSRTGVDALAVNVGQAHLHGRRLVALDQERVLRLKNAVGVPLVLHGASSIAPGALQEAIRGGVRKINVGSVLKRAFFDAVAASSDRVRRGGGRDYNPYEVVGSGTPDDVLTSGRIAVQHRVEELMELFGSAGRA